MDRESYMELESTLRDIIAERSDPRHLPSEFLKHITDNFSSDLELGRGGFGIVYKGLLEYEEIVVVKRLVAALGTMEKQYENEAHLLSLKHENIVRILGFCSEAKTKLFEHEGRKYLADVLERSICLEYMPNGSLDRYITGASSGLDWDQRYKIITGICCGLNFLHEENPTNTPIIHLDLKPANILLTNEMDPKITDFGLSRLFGKEHSRIYTKNNLGTRGYMAPEFVDRGKITKMSDIFSFGVIVLEIITGYKDYPWKNDTTTVHQNYVEKEVQKWRECMMEDLSSTFVEKNCLQIKNCIEIGLNCTNTDEMKRPTAKEIIDTLNRSLDSSNATASRGQDSSSADTVLPKPFAILPQQDSNSVTNDSESADKVEKAMKKKEKQDAFLNKAKRKRARKDKASNSEAFSATVTCPSDQEVPPPLTAEQMLLLGQDMGFNEMEEEELKSATNHMMDV